MPETATVEEVEHIYYEGWKLGLKALAIYRDNCKVGQPLSDARAKKASASTEAAESKPVEKEVVVEHRPSPAPPAQVAAVSYDLVHGRWS